MGTDPAFNSPSRLLFELWRIFEFWAPRKGAISISASEKSFEVNNPIKMTAMISLVGIDDSFRSINRLLLEFFTFFKLRATRYAVTVKFQPPVLLPIGVFMPVTSSTATNELNGGFNNEDFQVNNPNRMP